MTFKFKHAVLDTSPLIAESFLDPNLAENFWTVPDVVSEIKDAASKIRLQNLPFELKKRSPKSKTVGRVVDFSKKTGDFASLSATDIRLVALTVELHEEHTGEELSMNPCLGKSFNESTNTRNCNGDAQEESKLQSAEQTKDEDDGASVEIIGLKKDPTNSEFEGDWITPSNLKKQKKKQQETGPNEPVVGCISSDFAVQNILLQLKLRLYSLDGGKRITMIKNWLLRCHACYWTTLDNAKKFCGKCGGTTLTKTSYRVDASGNRELFLRDDYRYNLRGTKFTLPKVKTGRDAQVLVLREDQKEYQRALKHKARQEQKMQKETEGALEEYLERAFGSGMRGLGSSDGFKGNFQAGNIQIGYGKKNPNEKRKKY